MREEVFIAHPLLCASEINSASPVMPGVAIGGGSQASVARRSVRLFPEILVEIFTLLRPPDEWDQGSDKGDLASCCLVSRDWHNSALPQLFRTIHFRFTDDQYQNGSAAERDILLRGEEAPLEGLLDLLRASPAIRTSIRNLQLVLAAYPIRGTVPGPPLPPFEKTLEVALRRVSGKLIHSIVELLPCLQHLLLSGICLAAPLPRSIRSSLAIKSLALVHSVTSSPFHPTIAEDILGVVNMFREVEVLRVNLTPSSDSTQEGETTAPPCTTKISTFEWRSASLAIIQGVHGALDLSHLTVLHLPDTSVFPHDAAMYRSTQTLLRSGVGNQLVHLGVEWELQSDARMFEHLLLLCPSLRSVKIATLLCGDLSEDSTSCVWREDMLSTVARSISAIPSSVRHVFLELLVTCFLPTVPANPGLHAGAQNLVDEAFIARFGKRLPMVHIQPQDMRVFNDATVEMLSSLFPKLVAADCLVVQTRRLGR